MHEQEEKEDEKKEEKGESKSKKKQKKKKSDAVVAKPTAKSGRWRRFRARGEVE